MTPEKAAQILRDEANTDYYDYRTIEPDDAELIAQLVLTQAAIIDKLPKTEDGVPISPDMEVWQIDPKGMVNYGHPWRSTYDGPRFVPHYPFYSTREAAE